MSLFIDASALVAVVTREAGWEDLSDRLSEAERLLCSPISLWEASRAIARRRTVTVAEAHAEVRNFVDQFSVTLTPIGLAEGDLAIDAHDRYGKGTGHRANLNMGDCFAYACARANNARLLYKGDDFAHTDLA